MQDHQTHRSRRDSDDAHAQKQHDHVAHGTSGAAACHHSEPASLAKDPVCGMDVDPHTAKHRAEHGGRTYYFCSARCRERFLADPAAYLGEKAAVAEPVREGTIYTCPMHPQIRQVGLVGAGSDNTSAAVVRWIGNA